jgi:hypothetical protein
MKLFHYLLFPIYLIVLTACKGESEVDIERPTRFLEQGKVSIDVPKYFINDQPAQVKIILIGNKDYAVSGDLYVMGNGIERKVNASKIYLNAVESQATLTFRPDLENPQLIPTPITLEFRSKDSDRYSIRTTSLATPTYSNILNGGIPQTIQAGDEVFLNVATNKLMEDRVGGAINFTWRQLEGPSVQLNNASNKIAKFIAPEVSEITKLRFSVSSLVVDANSSAVVEKIVFVVPSKLWVKAIKTFDHGAIVVREDGSVVLPVTRPEAVYTYKLTRPLNDIKNMATLDPQRLLILYKDKTVDLVVFGNDGVPTLPYRTMPKAPILPYTYYSAHYFYTANNIEDINGLDHKGVWRAQIEWEPGVNVDKYFDVGANEGTETISRVRSYSPTLSDTSLLRVKFIRLADFFSIEKVAQYSEGLFSTPDSDMIGYLLLDNTPGVLSIDYASAGSDYNELLSKSPFQTTRFTDIQPIGSATDKKIFLLEENGVVSSYRKGSWEVYPFLHDIADLGALAVSNNGTASIWQDYDDVYFSLRPYRVGEIPSPYNISSVYLNH